MNRASVIREGLVKRRMRPYFPLEAENERHDAQRSHLAALNTQTEIAENRQLLDICAQYWYNLAQMRARRARVRNFLNGHQWWDRTDCGMTEEQCLQADGHYPARYNIMQPILKNMLGQMRGNQKKINVVIREPDKAEEEQILTNAVQGALELNMAEELDMQLVRERWTSGVIAQRIVYDWWAERDQMDILIENCDVTRVFFNTDVRDVRLLDMHTEGMVLDFDLEELIADANICTTSEDAAFLRQEYAHAHNAYVRSNLMDMRQQDMLDFYVPLEPNKCRVIEVWYRRVERVMYVVDTATGEEYITDYTAAEMEEENRLRQREIQQKNEIVAQYNAQNPNGEKASYFEYLPYEYEERFEKTTYYKRITPNGRTLCKGKSPYKHQSSPYVFEVRPLDDGDIQGEGNQLIDIQKLYNRLRLLMDIGIRHGVKGVLLIPSTAVPDGFTSEEYVKRIRTMGEYVIYKVDTKSAHAYKPEMVSGAMPIVGMIQGLLQDLKQMMSDISGTSQAMLGREEDRTITASQYKMESNNSAVNAVDFFKSFDAFLHRRNLKVLKLLQQYYPDMRRIVVRGVMDTSIFNYQAEKMAHLDTDVMILSNANTELQKAQSEASLKEAVVGGILQSPFAMLWLKNSSEPWAKGILADLEQMEQAQQQAQ